jgi:hypothetical protein
VKYTVPARPRSHDVVDVGDDASVTWDYDSQYRCWPPPLGMFIISIIEVGHYLLLPLKLEYFVPHSKGKMLTTVCELIGNSLSQVTNITLFGRAPLNIQVYSSIYLFLRKKEITDNKEGITERLNNPRKFYQLVRGIH